MKTLLDVLVENHEIYCLSFRCVLVNKSFIFMGVSNSYVWGLDFLRFGVSNSYV